MKHLYLITSPLTCFGNGKSQYYILCQKCLASMMTPLLSKGWSYQKETEVNTTCVRCDLLKRNGKLPAWYLPVN